MRQRQAIDRVLLGTMSAGIILINSLLLLTHQAVCATNQELLVSVTLVSCPFSVAHIKHLNSLGV